MSFELEFTKNSCLFRQTSLNKLSHDGYDIWFRLSNLFLIFSCWLPFVSYLFSSSRRILVGFGHCFIKQTWKKKMQSNSWQYFIGLSFTLASNQDKKVAYQNYSTNRQHARQSPCRPVELELRQPKREGLCSDQNLVISQ